MQRPATWKVAAVGAALTGLSFIGAGTAVAALHTDVIPERVMALADEADATAGNDVEALFTDSGDAAQPNGERVRFTSGNDSDSRSTSGNDSDSRSTDGGNDAGSRSTDGGDASQPNGERLLIAR
jgi:hypothetical protein